MANAQAYRDAHLLSQNLATAQNCSADEAFQILVRASQRENRKLREISEERVNWAQHASIRETPRG